MLASEEKKLGACEKRGEEAGELVCFRIERGTGGKTNLHKRRESRVVLSSGGERHENDDHVGGMVNDSGRTQVGDVLPGWKERGKA